jgi:hypothetical protein
MSGSIAAIGHPMSRVLARVLLCGAFGAACAPSRPAPAPPAEQPAVSATDRTIPSNLSPALAQRFLQQSLTAEARGLAEPFRGITTDGRVREGLFPVRAIGVSAAPVRAAAEAFLQSLSPAQRTRALFAVDDPEWRGWMNQHFYVRRGVGFGEMTEAQREAAFGLLRASLSAKGLQLSRDIMRRNRTLAELNDNDLEQYGEWLYWITLMGTLSATEPWGWQIDGHHLIINYFVLGEQVVMTPSFFGSEPVVATSGEYAGTAILQAEQDKGLASMQSLDAAQRAQAIVWTGKTGKTGKTGNDNVSEAFRDNVALDFAGNRATALSPAQREQLLELVHEFVGNLRDPHATVHMMDVRAHLDDTYFAWIGGTETTSVFYYRVHSPVLLIEFDHQLPVAIRHLFPGERRPVRQHIHAVIRTPNGNDYGADLLRQHHDAHPHPHRHRHG